MVYTLDDGQLLSIWSVINQLGLIRELPDPTDRSISLTRAQALLTMLALEVSPLPQDRNDATTGGPRPNGAARFDAYRHFATSNSAARRPTARCFGAARAAVSLRAE